MKNDKFEARFFQVRAAKATEDNALGILEGHASVFNSEAVIGGMFREVIMPGAFDDVLETDPDVRGLFNHNPDLVLARTTSGTMRLAVDDIGLATEMDLPDTTLGHDVAELVTRGDVDQMSFAFTVPKDGETWDEPEGKMPLRTITKVDGLFDASVVTYPAYPKAEVGLRSAEQVLNEHRAAMPPKSEPAAKHRLDLARLQLDALDGGKV